MNKMETLINILKELDESYVRVDKYGYLDSSHPLVKEVETLANDLLITKNGQLNIDNMEILDLAGYRTFPVERDRFGWLIGGIETNIGVIVYG